MKKKRIHAERESVFGGDAHAICVVRPGDQAG
jgi:hypothetical protein